MTALRTEHHAALVTAVNHLGQALQKMPQVTDLAEEDFQILDRVLGLYRKLRVAEHVLEAYLKDGVIRWPTHHRKIAVGQVKGEE